MKDAHQSQLLRLVVLCPQALVAEIDRLVDEQRAHEPTTSRAVVVRDLLTRALNARRGDPGVRAAG